MAANGNYLLIYKNGTLVAGLKSSDHDTSCNIIETASPTSGQWKTYIPGRKEWSVTANYLLAAVTDVSNMLQVGTTCLLSFRNRSGQVYLQGNAIVQRCKIVATRGKLMTGSFVFKGNGSLTP